MNQSSAGLCFIVNSLFVAERKEQEFQFIVRDEIKMKNS